MELKVLEGYNKYDASRLKKAGIVTVEQLGEKASDQPFLEKLASQTGIPIYRLIDLAEQANLYRFGGAEGVARLRNLGIRTLTDAKMVLGEGFIQESLDRISNAEIGNVQSIATSQIQLLAGYYNLVLEQASRSFRWAIIAAAVGLAFFIASVGFLLTTRLQSVAIISLISGSLVEVVSGINFYLYGKTSSQLADFQTRLDMTQRFLLANSICEGMENKFKQQSRTELVRAIAGIGPQMNSALTQGYLQ